MSETVLIVLPLPPRILSPNVMTGSRGGRMAKAQAAKLYRERAKRGGQAWTSTWGGGPWARATVSVRFFHATRRRRDDVNFLASLKPAYDGLVDAGLLEDDDAEHLTTLGATFEVDREAPRVELLLTRLAAIDNASPAAEKRVAPRRRGTPGGKR